MLIGAVLVTWEHPVCAQQRTSPVVGYLHVGSQAGGRFLEAFRQGLGETGYVEGRNVQLRLLFVPNDIGRIASVVSELIRSQAAVIVTPDSLTTTLAAKMATRTIPIVFGIGADPVVWKLVSHINHPDANLTGVTFINLELLSKRVELLVELLPKAMRFAALVHPSRPSTSQILTEIDRAISSFGRQLYVFYAATDVEIDSAFEKIARAHVDGLIVDPDSLFATNYIKIVRFAEKYRIPATYGGRPFTEAGGLMSYGDKRAESFRQMGIYTGRILKGENVADLPVVHPVKYEFIINIRTAKALGVDVPRQLLAFADELIE
jgi:putative ABC transport system substrate-binding protein